jgi:hypothetical protein
MSPALRKTISFKKWDIGRNQRSPSDHISMAKVTIGKVSVGYVDGPDSTFKRGLKADFARRPILDARSVFTHANDFLAIHEQV